MAYKFQFGSYVFPATLRPADDTASLDNAAQARPRGSGSRTQIARTEPTRLQVRGDLTAATAADLQALESALKAATFNRKAVLWFGRDDRYYRDAQLRAFGTGTREGMTRGIVQSYALEFEAADYPEAFSVTPVTATLTSTGGTLNVTGEAPALPTWTITIDDAGTGPLTLTNTATGEVAILNPIAFDAGDVILLALDGRIVTRNGDREFGLFDRRIPSLIAGSNVITLAAGGTATVAALEVTYTPRYF